MHKLQEFVGRITFLHVTNSDLDYQNCIVLAQTANRTEITDIRELIPI